MVQRSDGITLVRNDCMALVETSGVSGMPVNSHNNIHLSTLAMRSYLTYGHNVTIRDHSVSYNPVTPVWPSIMLPKSWFRPKRRDHENL